MESRICTCCKQQLDLTCFSPLRNGRFGKQSQCKKCRSKQTSSKQIERQARKQPENYKVCNTCDRIFNKVFKNRSAEYILTKCRFCKSEDVENY